MCFLVLIGFTRNKAWVAQMRSARTSVFAEADISYEQVAAPVVPDLAWELESLLLRIFEYGDYSFRSALDGTYSDTLNCTFALARCRDVIVGAAGCLYSGRNPVTAILGPVGVDPRYRRNGIGANLVRSIIDHLRVQGCMAVYLGVSEANPARRLYEGIGFRRYHGVVMRLLLCSQTQLHKRCFGGDSTVAIRRVTWGDFPAVQALLSSPCRMHTFDLQRGIFSSRHSEPTRFLSVFPEMMRTFAKVGGFANVLAARERHDVVGIAQIRRLPARAQHHIAECDFFVHDNFIEQAVTLVETTIRECAALSVRRINCCCLSCDRIKRDILEHVGGRHAATLPGQVYLHGRYADVFVYQIERGA